jgi:glycosyltransferase involved in cell wall biosynthesis
MDVEDVGSDRVHICILTGALFQPRDGVGDYAWRLAQALSREHRVSLVGHLSGEPRSGEDGPQIVPLVEGWGAAGRRHLFRIVRDLRPDVLNVQYTPFLYHRWGLNLGLPLLLLRLRMQGMPIVTMVHEPFVPLRTWKWWILGPIQRALLALWILASRRVLVSIWAWTEMLRRMFRWRAGDIRWLAVGSNLSPVGISPEERRHLREKWGLPGSGVVLVMLNPLGTGKQFDLVSRVWKRLASRHEKVGLLIVGVGREEALCRFPAAPDGDRTAYTGFVPDEVASRLLGCADVGLAPYVDGLSTRRSSTISMMAHGLPIVSTRAELTDPGVFDDFPIPLVSPEDEMGFERTLEELIRSPEKRAEAAEQTRRFFQHHFAWEVLEKQFLEVAIEARGSNSP